MRCPHCLNDALQQVGDDLKLRVPILVFNLNGEKCRTNCPRCKREILLPLRIIGPAERALLDAKPEHP